MTSINDLEDRIKDAEAALDAMKTDLEHLKQQEQPEPESLFGRWATHPNFGRGIIISDHGISIDDHEDAEAEVEFAYVDEAYSTGTVSDYVPINTLTIDPVVLTTVEDYEQAPIGTIIVGERVGEVACKVGKSAWTRIGNRLSKSAWSRIGNGMPWSDDDLAKLGTTGVIRWGTGE